MIKQIKTEKFEGLAVLIPSYNLEFKIFGKSLFTIGESFVSLLPSGSYEIIGKATELTEEQCAEIVRCV